MAGNVPPEFQDLNNISAFKKHLLRNGNQPIAMQTGNILEMLDLFKLLVRG